MRAATSAAAALLRCDDRGILAVGKRADVVVADARARVDVTALESPRAVFVGGERYTGPPPGGALDFGLAFFRGLARTAIGG